MFKRWIERAGLASGFGLLSLHLAWAGEVAPDWIKKPTGDDIAAVYPRKAADEGIWGKVIVKCRIGDASKLNDCAVLRETPQGWGFGAATLKLTARFLAPRSSSGGEVTIPISMFTYPGPSSRRNVTVETPHWTITPTVEQVISAFPKEAVGRAESGLVRLHCHQSDCRVSSAEPAGLGFEQAALALSTKFRLDAVWQFDLGADQVTYDLTIRLAAPDSDIWKTHPLGQIEWVETPDPAIARSLFPPGALKLGSNKGSAVVLCTVATNGALSGCSAESESPVGMGYGQAIAEVAQHYVMNRWAKSGLPAGGGHVRLPMTLVYEPDPPLAPTPATTPSASPESPPPAR